MSYQKQNTLLGWAVFIVAAIVYLLCCEPTTSFWDCGEYISTSYKLQVGHPPGAPFFQLLGRFFSLFTFGHKSSVAFSINAMSALFSAATIMFLFWTITYFARKLVCKSSDLHEYTVSDRIIIFGAGMIGALAYTFSDTFWFSAVEGEVYALSSFFTAVTFWAVLKWEEQSANPKSARWLILIAYLIGLSIGVHLLNLLAIPAVIFIIYFKKYKYSLKGFLLTIAISIALLALILWGIIPYLLIGAGKADFLFANNLNLPIGSGTVVYFILIAALLAGGILYSVKRRKPLLNSILLCSIFLLIGYSSFLILVIRSNSNTPINENKPNDAFALTSYLGREQYGQTPLLYAPYYNAPAIAYKDAKPTYAKQYKIVSKENKKAIASFFDKNEAVQFLDSCKNPLLSLQTSYGVAFDGKGAELEFPKEFYTFFPRMWSSQDQHAYNYAIWGGGQGTVVDINGHSLPKPTFAESMRFFLSYQLGYMYVRYFMWNFAGKFNNIQGHGDLQNGQWISGIPIIDKHIIGTSEPLPEAMQNKGHNRYYLLPFLLGIIGLFFQLQNSKKNWFVLALLFVFTGIAIVIYLNQAAYQPRERDYAYAASFYVFTIWIGLGCVALYKLFSKILKKKTILASSFTVFLCAGVPALMARENWDDHDRSGRTVALDLAVNFLESCAPNAILFTNGDNETFPLWYAQEVEGIRTDVRVVNLSLLNADWYIDNCKRKVYDSDKLPISFSKNQYIDRNREYILLHESEEKLVLKDALDFVRDDNNFTEINGQRKMYYLPSNKLVLDVDTEKALLNCAIPNAMRKKVRNHIELELQENGIVKASLMQLDLIANLNWERPVYFLDMSPDTYVGLQNYLQQEGFAYRLVPVKTQIQEEEDENARNTKGYVNTDLMYHNLMHKFQWGNLASHNVYMDETAMRAITGFKEMFVTLSNALLAEGKKDSAIAVLNMAQKAFPTPNIPYDAHNLSFAFNYLQAGKPQLAIPIFEKMLDASQQKLDYYFKLSKYHQAYFRTEIFKEFNTVYGIFDASSEFHLKSIYENSYREYFRLAPAYLDYCNRELSGFFASEDVVNFLPDITRLMETVSFLLQKSRDFNQNKVSAQAEEVMKQAIHEYNELDSLLDAE